MKDPLKNHVRVSLASGFTSTATEITLLTGQGASLPTEGDFNLVVYNSTNYTDPTDDPQAVIVRVVGINGDVLTIQQPDVSNDFNGEGSENVALTLFESGVNYKAIVAFTKKTYDDIHDAIEVAGNRDPVTSSSDGLATPQMLTDIDTADAKAVTAQTTADGAVADASSAQAKADANETDINALTPRVTTLEGTVSSQGADISDIQTVLQSDTNTLDDFQEVVDFIKANRSDLDALSVSNIAGLSTALATLTTDTANAQTTADDALPIAGGTMTGDINMNNRLLFGASELRATKLGIGVNAVSRAHIYQNDSATGSETGLTIEQDGAGDATLQFLLSSVTRVAMGLDNSDGNKFKIGNIGFSTPYVEWDSSGATSFHGSITLPEGSKGLYMQAKSTADPDFTNAFALRIGSYLQIGHGASGNTGFIAGNALLDYSRGSSGGSNGSQNRFVPVFNGGGASFTHYDYSGNIYFYNMASWDGVNTSKRFPQDMSLTMTLTEDNKVGVGTSNPAEKLDVVGGSIQAGEANAEGHIRLLDRDNVGSYAELAFAWGQAANPALRLVNSLQQATFQMRSSIVGILIDRADENASSSFIIRKDSTRLDTGGIKMFEILANGNTLLSPDEGNVGIGTVSAGARLEIHNAVNQVGVRIQQDAQNEALRVQSIATAATVIESYSSGLYTGSGYNSAHRFALTNALATGVNTEFRHDGSGGTNVRIYSTNGSIALQIANIGSGRSLDVAGQVRLTGLPTVATGLDAGDLWNDGGTLKIA